MTVLCPFRSLWPIIQTSVSLKSHSYHHSLCADGKQTWSMGLVGGLSRTRIRAGFELVSSGPDSMFLRRLMFLRDSSLCSRLGDRVRVGSCQVTAFALCSCQHWGHRADVLLFANRMSVPRQACLAAHHQFSGSVGDR